MRLKGVQIAIDMYGCKYDALTDSQKTQDFLRQAIENYALAAYDIHYNIEENGDYSFNVPCQHGHLNLHIFPELGFTAVDIFTCQDNANPDKLAVALKKYFSPDKAKITFIQRGDFGSQNDMKPRRKSQIKPMHRAKSAGKQLLKIVMGPKKKNKNSK